MLNVKQLTRTVDSLKKSSVEDFAKKIKHEVYDNFAFTKWIDSGWGNAPPVSAAPTAPNYARSLPDSARKMVLNKAIDKITTAKSALDIVLEEGKVKQKELRYHLIELHRKFALSMACMVLFLIGAPLGSIIRKGGVGMPLVIAVIFFLIFHLLNMFGEKFAKTGVTSAFFGMWLSTMILVPIGIFLTYKAMHDSQLFNKEFYYRTFRFVRLMISKIRTPKKEVQPA